MRKTMIAVAAAGALGMATMATSTMAFGHGGGGHGGGAGHFGGGEAHFGGGHIAGGFQNRHFGRGIRDGFGGVSPYYGYDYSSCYVVTCPPSALMRQIGWVEEGRISGSS